MIHGHGKEGADMWIYEKRLEFPVNIKEPNAQMAQFTSAWQETDGIC